MNDTIFKAQVIAEFVSDHKAGVARLLEAQRILRERDDNRQWALENAADDTHRSPGNLWCGCAPEHFGKSCAKHAAIEESLK